MANSLVVPLNCFFLLRIRLFFFIVLFVDLAACLIFCSLFFKGKLRAFLVIFLAELLRWIL